MWNINNTKGIGDNIMLKPYKRQQMQTDRVLSFRCDTYYKDILKQILTHKDTLYNIIKPNIEGFTPLEYMITNTDSVVIVIHRIAEHVIVDKHGGYILNSLECTFVGTGTFSIYSDVSYIIETNYKSVHDVYSRLCVEWCKTHPTVEYTWINLNVI